MRGSLEDKDAIRSPQVSLLLFVSHLFSISSFFIIIFSLPIFPCRFSVCLLSAASGDKTSVKVQWTDVTISLSVTLRVSLCAVFQLHLLIDSRHLQYLLIRMEYIKYGSLTEYIWPIFIGFLKSKRNDKKCLNFHF